MNIETKFLHHTLSSPIMPASGPLSDRIDNLKFFNENKVGMVVTKTISVEGAKVNKPCITVQNGILHNTELWSEHSLDEWNKKILPSFTKNKPWMISVGYTAEELRQVVPVLEPYADYFEVSTHYHKDDLKRLVAEITSLTDKPVFIKLSPYIEDYLGFVETVVAAGAKGIVATNSLGPGLVIDMSKGRPRIGTGEGRSWISGPAIKPIALERVYQIKKKYPDLTVIGCGGVQSARDVLEFLLAGAEAVQLLSSALIKGKDLYDKIVADLPKELEKFGFSSIEEVKATGLKPASYLEEHHPDIAANCILCGKCVASCPVLALSLEDKVVVNEDRCMSCGLCQSICPVDAISGVI